jgi:hypothetical protein
MRIFNRFLKVVLIRDGVVSGPADPYEAMYGETLLGQRGFSYIDKIKTYERRDVSQKLKTEVKIGLSKKTGSDSGHVKIWNPSSDTINFIKSGEGGIVEIYAGYEDWSGLIFRGEIGGNSIISVDTDGPDVVLKYALGSYTDKYQSAFFRGSFPNGNTADIIIKTALDANGIPHVGFDTAFGDRTWSEASYTINNFVWSGKVTDLIKTMVENYGLQAFGIEIYYDKGVVVCTSTSRVIDGDSVVRSKTEKIHKISSATGLIDTPRWVHDCQGRKFEFKCVVNPELSRNSLVDLFSEKDKKVNGRYVIDEIEYDLSNWDGPFLMECSAHAAK